MKFLNIRGRVESNSYKNCLHKSLPYSVCMKATSFRTICAENLKSKPSFLWANFRVHSKRAKDRVLISVSEPQEAKSCESSMALTKSSGVIFVRFFHIVFRPLCCNSHRAQSYLILGSSLQLLYL